MAGMDMTPAAPGGDPGALGWFAVTWVGDDGGHDAARLGAGGDAGGPGSARGRRRRATAAGFVSAYGAVWLLAGLAGYACVQAVRALDVGALGWASAGRYVAAAVVVRGRALPAHAGQAPLARALHGAGTASPPPRHRGRAAGRRRARGLLRRVLLDAHGRALRARVHEPDVDGGAHGPHRGRATGGAAVGRRRRRSAAVLVVLGVGIAVAPASVPGLTIPRGRASGRHGHGHGHALTGHIPGAPGHLRGPTHSM